MPTTHTFPELPVINGWHFGRMNWCKMNIVDHFVTETLRMQGYRGNLSQWIVLYPNFKDIQVGVKFPHKFAWIQHTSVRVGKVFVSRAQLFLEDDLSQCPFSEGGIFVRADWISRLFSLVRNGIVDIQSSSPRQQIGIRWDGTQTTPEELTKLRQS